MVIVVRIICNSIRIAIAREMMVMIASLILGFRGVENLN